MAGQGGDFGDRFAHRQVAGVVGEAMLAIALTDAWIEKFGGDSLSEMRRNVAGYLATLRRAAPPE